MGWNKNTITKNNNTKIFSRLVKIFLTHLRNTYNSKKLLVLDGELLAERTLLHFLLEYYKKVK